MTVTVGVGLRAVAAVAMLVAMAAMAAVMVKDKMST